VKFALEQSEAKVQQHLQSSPVLKNKEYEQTVAALRSMYSSLPSFPLIINFIIGDLKVYQEQERKFKHAQEEARELREAAKNSELLQEKIQSYKIKAERFSFFFPLYHP
jgi:hypothetical protein